MNNVGELGIRVKEQNVGGEEKEVEEIMKSKSKMHNAAAPGGLLSSHPLMLKLWCWLSFLFQLYFFSQKLNVQKKSELCNKRTDYPCVAHYSLL